MSQALSTLRSQLRKLVAQVTPLTETFLEREPLLPGSVYILKRRCGKPTCRCATGELHATEILSYRGGSRPRNVTPQPGQLRVLRQTTEAYRRFRQARAELVKLQRQLLQRIDGIEAERVREGKRWFEQGTK